MQNRHTKSYSNLQTQLEIDWEEERRALLEDQKKYRMRAQKLSIETNRRRKALEDRRKEEEEKEQKFREQVLQQRKLKLQEATEKFQRGHLPPSQRTRRTAYVVSRKPAPKLDDALDQIQGSFAPSYYYLPNNRNHHTIREAPSSVFTAGNGTWHKPQQPDSKLGYERIIQEQKNNFQFDSNRLYFQHKLEEAQRLLEEQHLSNLQNFQQEVEQLAHSESLDSLDSLEEELEEPEQTNILEDFTCENRHRTFSENTPYSVKNPARGTDSTCQHASEHGGFLNDKNILFDQTPTANHLHSRNQMVLHDHSTRHDATHSAGRGHNENIQVSSTQIQENSQRGNFEQKLGHSDLVNAERRTSSHFMAAPAKAWATPDPTLRNAGQGSIVQKNKEAIQHPVVSTKPTMAQDLVTPVCHPLTEWECSAGGCHNGVSTGSKNNLNLAMSTENLNGTNSAYMNSTNNERIKCTDGTNQGGLVHEQAPLSSSNRARDFGETHNQSSSSSSSATPTPTEQEPGYALYSRKARNNVSVMDGNLSLKGILKKGSKYEYARTVSFKMLHIGDSDGTTSIRDSVELTKEKDGNKRIKGKKLRWLDEIDRITIEKDVKRASKPVHNAETRTSADILSSTRNLGVSQSNINTFTERTDPPSGSHTSVFSTGYHFTKQAWVNTKGVETNTSEHSTRTLPRAKTKVARRPKSARTQYTVPHRHKRGTIIRPQSATEASKIFRSQGKVMVPHPPARPGSDNPTGQNTTDAKAQYVSNETYPFNGSSNNVATSVHISAKDTGPTQGAAQSPGNMVTVQHYKAPEAIAKAALALNNDRPLTLKESVSGPSKRYPVYGENGLRLDHTPTDEEIALLWQGVRSALTYKNTGYITLARRKHIADSSENKRRALLEQRKGRAGSAALRNPHPQNQHNVKANPFPSSYEPVQTYSTPLYNEVSESMTQFMVAENLVDTSATEGEILAAMQATQANRQTLGNQKSHGPGPSALSLEEQRLLQSLDRLNHRLQNVQDVIGKTPTAATGFALKPALNIQPFSSQPSESAAPPNRFRSLSADPRSRLQRRY
uniref:Centrosomal protein 126 n=1 Tax=Leptobrachium leishanense TaxID=445787 RepID=A0A8C5QCZ1_9ANUR